MANTRYYVSIGLEGLRKIMTNLRQADVLAQHFPYMGLEHGHCARLLIFLGTVCLGTEVLSIHSQSQSNLQTTNTGQWLQVCEII
jgi:hypothetical protein